MGNSSSSISLDLEKKFNWNLNKERQCISFNKIINPLLYYEKNILFFIEACQDNDFFPFSKNKLHKAEDLAKLLLGFYEELDNIPQILETLIENNIEPENNVIKYLCNCFYCYTQNAKNRILLYKNTSEFLASFITSFNVKSLNSIENLENPSFSMLLSAISTSFLILDNHNIPFEKYVPFLDFMIDSITTASITPPSPEFIPNEKNSNIYKDQMIRAGYINPHGICSNGNFLFILCSNNIIQIFPLINGGSLSSLIVVKLDKIGVEIPHDASINAFADIVQIIYKDNEEYKCISLDIESLIQNKMSAKINPAPYEFNCKCSCSDGITQIIIEPDNSIRTFDLIQKKQISISKFDQSISQLQEHLHSTIVETNGSFISFIIQNINNGRNSNENHENNNDNDNNNNNDNNDDIDENINLALFKTYSSNGKFLKEEKFQVNEPIIASCIDSFHKCHWSVISGGNSIFYIRRYNLIGGENPEIFNINRYEYPTDQKTTPLSFVCKLISSIHRHLRGMINSQVSPNLFLLSKASEFNKLFELLDKMINLPDEKYELLKDFKQATIECLVILISLNLKKISCTSKPDESLTTKIIEIVKKLPINLASLLFFSNFDYLMIDQKDDTVILLIQLLKLIKNDLLIMFSFRIMEQSKSLSMIRFKKTNYLFDLLPKDLKKTSSIEPNILMFLLLHQRVLVRNSLLFLEDNHLEVIHFLPNNNNNNKTVLDLLGDYMQNIISIFENVFSSFEPDEIEDLAIFDLFSNFINLLSSLSDFHSISQITTGFISVIVNSLSKIFNSYPKQVLMIIFVLGKLASTLLKGDEITNLETKFLSLISSNMDLVDHPDLINNLDNENIENFENEQINLFLNSDSMNSIYKKIKPLINKNLNHQIKEIDKLAIIAFSKHLNCLDELLSFNDTKTPSAQLRWAFDQMVLVRNEFRRCLQTKKDPTIYKIKCLMLFRMKCANDIDKSKKLSDFVVMKFEPSYFKKILIGQRKRIQTTLVGFSLLDKTYNLNANYIIHKIINYNLSMIKSFENMESIIKMIKLNNEQENQIFLFFERMITNSIKENSMLLIIVCYRFFRDVDCLKDIKNSILNTTLDIFKSNPNNISIFALALSLINGATAIPSQLLKINANKDLYNWILLFEITKKNLPQSDFTSLIIQYFWNSEISNEEIRPILRVIYNIQELIIEYELFFSNCFLYIGNEIKKLSNFSKSSEIISFLRQILINDEAPLKEKLINYILCFNYQTKNEELLLGIMSVLGLNIEEIHQFSTINYHPSRSELRQYYVISVEKDTILCYPKPFRLSSSKKISIPLKSYIYSVPQTDMQPEKFSYFEYILQFFDQFYQYLNSNPLIYAIYMQVFASYCRIPDFVSIISEDILSKIYEESISFHDILKTIEYINKLNNMKIVQTICGFNVLGLTGFNYTTFLSQVIDENTDEFELNIRFPKIPWNGLYIGIVSDNLEPYYTRYKLVSFPDGTVYPRDYNSNPDHFKNIDQNIKVFVDYKSKRFEVNDKSFKFPIGSQFRVIFATNMKNHNLITIKIYSNTIVFNDEAMIPIQSFNINKESVLYSACRMPEKLPYDFNKLPDFPQIVSNYSGIEKTIFTDPPSNIIIHGYNLTSISEPLYNSLIKSAFRKLSFQFSSISLMRIINTNVRLVKPVVFKLFQYFIYFIESFSVPLMEQNNFPFDITMPIWNKDVDPTYFSLENEVKKSLKKIVADQENVTIIAKNINKLFNSKKVHCLMFPQESLKFFIDKQDTINLHREKSYLLFNNDFDCINKSSIQIFYNNYKLPIIYTTSSKAVNVKILDKNRIIGYLCMDPINNDWLINTPIELLLLLKNFVFIATQEEHQTMIKSIILKCFIINSPVISLYLNQFTDFILSQIPPSMADQGKKYSNQLALAGSRLKEYPNQTFIGFYQREQQLLSNKMAAELSSHFPEFLATPFPKPKNKMCKISFIEIDPGDLTDNFSDHIVSFRTFLKSYNSLVGFPFWEILPYWIKLTDSEFATNDSNSKSNSSDQVKATRITNEIIKVTNPTNSLVKVYLKKRPGNRKKTPEDSVLMRSDTSDFKNAEYIDPFHFQNPISVKKGNTFFSLCLLDQNNAWDLFYLDLEYNEQRQQQQETRQSSKTDIFVNDDEIRENLIKDMKQFAIEWRESDTYELLSQIPHDNFTKEKFDEIERIARLSSLTSKYNSTVVVLRALILHHYNYIYLFHHDDVSDDIWKKTNSLLSIEIQSQIVLSSIKNGSQVPNIEIDRQISQVLVTEKKGNRRNSIISQLSAKIKNIGAPNIRNKNQPWNVNYKNENGIDAGGLCRDLIVEASNSIFQPTSKLMVKVDGSTTDETHHYYVPNENALDELDEFYSIGVLIGIIMRTGLIQDLPFAPFIWKWIAGELIDDEDILECDRNFRQLFNDSDSNNLKWNVVCWNGSISSLKNRNPNSLVNKSQLLQYRHECVTFRKQSIRPMVEKIRRGFFDNTGINICQKLKGLLISRLAQGSGIITIEHLKSITDVSKFSGGMNNEYIKRFWRVVARFNQNELKLLLKFITSLTRIPSDSRLNSRFKIIIDKFNPRDPDSFMPKSSTCFNQLHLPCYTNDEAAYNRISYAIKFCSSMENA